MIGAALGLVRAPWWLSLLLAVGWEVVERPLKRATPGGYWHKDAEGKPTQDTWGNMTGDVVGWTAGWAAGRGLRRAADRTWPPRR